MFWWSFGPDHESHSNWHRFEPLQVLTKCVFEGQAGRSERARSALLPLHERLIVAADGEEVCVVIGEHDTDDVLGVTAVAAWLGLDAWVVEDVDETVVITSGEELLVSGAANGVNVGAVSARWVDTRGLPEELAGNGSPNSVLQV